MKTPLFMLLLTLAGPLQAGTVRFIFTPPVADTHTSVDVFLHGTWPTGNAGPEVSGVAISGSQIAIRLASHSDNTPSGYAIEWSSTAHLGILAGGVYDVSATITLPSGNALPADHTKLIVRDNDSALLFPNVVPIGGGQVNVGLSGQPDPYHRDAVDTVSVDGGPFVHPDSGYLLTLAPHAAGTVAMKVKTVDGVTYDVPAAITFFDPVVAPDPALFEPFLFPVSFSGDGAFSSRWSTVNTLHVFGLHFFRTPVPCDVCDPTLPMVLKTTNAPSGQLLWVVRDFGFLVGSSNVRELTRGAITRIPLLREKDLLRSYASFVEVPRLAHARTMLRVWILGSTNSETLQVIASSRAKSATFSLGTAIRTANDHPLFVTLDISALLDQVDDGGPISVSVRSNVPDIDDERMWALLSITDNVTQQTTIVVADPPV